MHRRTAAMPAAAAAAAELSMPCFRMVAAVYILLHHFVHLTLQGFKMQNRAIEGDEVAIRILPPSEWYQLASAKAAAEAEATKEAAAGGAAAQVAPGRSNVVPAALPSRAAAAEGAPPPTPLTAAVGAAPAAMTPPVWANGQQRQPTGDLVASPAMLPSGK